MIIYKRIKGNEERGMTASSQRNSRLGRGLASLISGAEDDQRSLPLGLIKPGRFNPRRSFSDAQLEELAASIRERGLVQPLVVRPSAADPTTFEIVAGERRWRAAQRATLHEVPVVVRALTDREAVALALIENVQREDLNAIEEGEGYKLLMDGHGYTQEDLAKVIGKSRSHLANTLRLLRLPEGVQELVREGALSAGHARALVGRPDAAALALRIVNEGLTVREIRPRQKRENRRTCGLPRRNFTRHSGSRSRSARAKARRASSASAIRASTSSRTCVSAYCGSANPSRTPRRGTAT